MSEATSIIVYVIYDHPLDYPKEYVVRRWWSNRFGIFPEQEPVALTRSLEAARRIIPSGLMLFERTTNDDPCISEVWA